MSLSSRLQDWLAAHGIGNSATFLLAVSGGGDSVAMAALFHELGLQFAIAHCNFKLRGEASDEDEAFVAGLSGRLEVPFHSISWDTKAEAGKRGSGVQETARALRYSWLEQLIAQYGFAYCATAHHLHDSSETTLHHLIRGTGVSGLQGIPPVRGKFIRPLLNEAPGELKAYLDAKNISWREDASNQSDGYTRNFIRHNIIPRVLEVNPQFHESLQRTHQRLRETEWLALQAVRAIAQQALLPGQEAYTLRLGPLQQSAEALPTVMWELGKAFGLQPGQAQQAADLVLEGKKGRFLETATHRFVIGHKVLAVAPKTQAGWPEGELAEGGGALEWADGVLSLSYRLGQPDLSLASPCRAFFDAAALKFPLRVRGWQAGDKFSPLGMSGQRQKLKDYFNNQKLSVIEKEKTPLLVDAEGDILWVAGHRVSHKGRVQRATSRYYEAVYERGG